MAYIKGKYSRARASSTRSLNREIDTKRNLRESQSQTASQQQAAQQTGVTSSLDAETQQYIKDLIVNLGIEPGTANVDLINQLTSSLGDRALNADAVLADSIKPIIAGARQKGEQEIQALQTRLAKEAGGSTANTLVASSAILGRAELETQLAAQEAELTLQTRKQGTEELLSSLSQTQASEQSGVENIASLLSILKGSNVQQQQSSTQQQSSKSDLSKILDEITKSITKESEVKHAKSESLSISGGYGNA